MSYIYDIILNFQKNYYEFYEWNDEDEITHIKKIPIFKTTTIDFQTIKKDTIKFSEKFLETINNKTEKFKKNYQTKIKYCFLLSDGKEVIAIKLNKEGLTTQKSSLLIDESEDILNILKLTKGTILNYKIIQQKTIENFQTRHETEKKQEILKLLENTYKQNDLKKLSYLCLECFGQNETNIDIAFSKLKKEINEPNENFHKIINFFKLIIQK